MNLSRVVCPNCGKCPYPEGVCEERVSRGRRFFLMGALALPLAAKIETLAPIVAPSLVLVTDRMSMLTYQYTEDAFNGAWEVHSHKFNVGVWGAR